MRITEEVRRLEVAVDDADGMRVRDRVASLKDEDDGLLRGKRAVLPELLRASRWKRAMAS